MSTEDDSIPSEEIPGAEAEASSVPVKSSATHTFAKSSDRFRAPNAAESLGEACAKCFKPVYTAEKLLACNKTWHKSCFCCGGAGNDGCNRVLQYGQQMMHFGVQFCKSCHPKVVQNSHAAKNISATGTNLVTSGDRVAEFASLTGSSGKHVADRAKIFKNPTSPGGPQTPQSAEKRGPSAADKFRSPGAGVALGDRCKACDKMVYTAEKIIAQGVSWHKMCFCCGGKSGKGCGKSLKPGEYEETGGVAFCKNCSRKNHDGNVSTLAIKGAWTGIASPPLQATGSSVRPPAAPAATQQSAAPESLESAKDAADAPAAVLAAAPETESAAAPAAEQDASSAAAAVEEPLEGEQAAADYYAEGTEGQEGYYAEGTEGQEGYYAEGTEGAAPTEGQEGYEQYQDEHHYGEGEEALTDGTGERTVAYYECPYTTPFDGKGAIYWVGTSGHQIEFENPQVTGLVYVEISTLYRGQLVNLTAYTQQTTAAERIAFATYTNNQPRSWILVDFGPERRLRPSYYCLKHGASGVGNAVRNWVLEGKADESSDWVMLSKHSKDMSLGDEPGSVAGFEITSDAAKSSFFRMFRMTQTGKNSGNNDCLFIGGMEFYGILQVVF